MKKEIIKIYIFISRVFLQWSNLALLLPSVYDFISVYISNGDAYTLPKSLTNYYLIIIVFISIYNVWRKEYIANEKSKNSTTKFEIDASFYKLTAEETVRAIKDEIQELEEELPNLVNPLIRFPFDGIKSRQDVADYIELLQDYIERLDSYFKSGKNTICFMLKVNSDRYDERISINARLSEGYIKDSIYDLNLPEKPTPTCDNYLMGLSSFLPNIDITRNYRTNIQCSDRLASCDISEIKPEQGAFFFNDYLFITINEKPVNLEIEINSKGSDGSQYFQLDLNPGDISESIDISSLKD